MTEMGVLLLNCLEMNYRIYGRKIGLSAKVRGNLRLQDFGGFALDDGADKRFCDDAVDT